MAVSVPPAEGSVSPAHVWSSLPPELQAQAILLMAQLAWQHLAPPRWAAPPEPHNDRFPDR
jgi:hypothetical protein